MIDLQAHGITVNGSGSGVRTICPQCSPGRKKKNEKCLSVNTIEGCWFCHHCGWTGGVKGSYEIFEVSKDPLPERVLEYFLGRGISETTLESNHIEYSGGWVKFPYFYNSVCVNKKYRNGKKQFRQEKGGKSVLYRYDNIRRSNKKTLVITEGEIDALSVVEIGIEATSIPDGAPSADAKNFSSKFDFLNNTEEVFAKFDKIILACDSDGPGQRATRELGRRIGFEKCYVTKFPEGCKDANDVLVNIGATTLAHVLSESKPFPVDGIIKPTDCLDVLMEEYDDGVMRGELTGWDNLDELYTVREGEMTIVTGIPGSGKSNFVDALCVNLINWSRWRIGYFSPENWPVQRHVKTLIEKFTGKTFNESQYGQRMNKDEAREATEFMDDYIKFIVPEDEIITVDLILKYARIMCLQYGIKGLVIDPWNEIEHDMKHGEREDQYISRSLTKIRRFARLNQMHIWVVAHPTKLHKNKDGKYDPPTMYDIAGGAHWRNKADNGICVCRDFETNKTEILIQKIRFREIGKIGMCELRYKFNGAYDQI